MKMEKYIIKVREQLDCNSTQEDREMYGTYKYSNEDIDNNKDYFIRCADNGLSAYKALLFFGDYLEGNYEI